MASPTTLHIGRPCHLMHCQRPRRTICVPGPGGRAGLRPTPLLGRCGFVAKPPVHRLSPLPTVLRGSGGATLVAFVLQLRLHTATAAAAAVVRRLPCCSGCSCCHAVVVEQQHFSCCSRAAGAAPTLLLLHVDCSAFLLQHVGGSSLQPTPALLPIKGLCGRCVGSPPTAAAAVVLQSQWQLSCCSCHAAALPLLLSRCRRGSRLSAAACGQQLTAADSRPVTSRRALGVLQQQPSFRRRRGGGGDPPPLPHQSDHHGKKRDLLLGKSGCFWYTNFWVPEPPPTPL